MPDHYRLLGGPGSPYSLKMRAVLRYRRIPHTWAVPRGYLQTAPELQKAAKGMIPVMQIPEGDYWADTTPMIYALEQRHPGVRSIVHPDPASAFLSHLVEDFGDEMLVQPMFAYRWSKTLDQQFCSRRQMAGWLGATPSAQFDDIVSKFIARQTERLARMGTLQRNMPFLEHVYLRTLDAIERLLDESDYLFGSRPALADFGLYGQLSQCAIDPSASDIFKARAPRAFQWVQTLDDASGNEGEWRAVDAPEPQGLCELTALIAEIYVPYLVANAQAKAAGAPMVEMQFAGREFVARTAPYPARCLQWLKAEFAGLDAPARDRVRALLGDAVVAALHAEPAELAATPPQEPR
ncbi:MAG: glutathione S-transferase [Hyphomicrobiales bacterium]|nr:glutathione S-transferase [Hyphomicrobiales bacterium]